jgi:predicted PurR-regulated permease PerM
MDVFGLGPVVDQLFDDVRTAPDGFVQSDRVLELINSATTNILWVAVILIVTFYLLLDWARLRDWMIALAPAELQPDMSRLYERIRDIWQEYLRGTLVLMVVIGVLTGISLAVVGMPGAAALGVLTGVLDAILSVGPAVAMIVAIIVAWLQGSTYLPINNVWFVAIVAGIYLVIQGLENVYLRPRIMGRRLQMHPAVVFLAIVGALSLVGPVGALIVLPVIATLGVIGGYLRRRVLGLDPFSGPDPLAPVYSGVRVGDKRQEEGDVNPLES